LTSGLAKTAETGIKTISKLIAKADGRIEIMAGSGIGVHNAMQIAKTGVDALHFTAYRPKAVVKLGMGDQLLLDEEKMTGIPALFRHDLL
jgi:copper homeostasis protein CutC